MATLFSCAGKRPDDLGVRESRLAPCPASPNCVCSDEEDESHRVDPIQLGPDPQADWAALREIVRALPRTTITEDEPGYLRAECASRLFGFVDDLELHLRAEDGTVAVRSASRLGHSDLGVNRRRVEEIREALRGRASQP